jgi:asparagine synthase (glutamine-hydrolysing)
VSGFAAVWRRDGGAAAGLTAVMGAMTHRGPDGAGTWAAGPVSLGRLRTALAHNGDAKPARLDRLAVTAVCRIDNRAELRSMLGLGGTQVADPELILHAYRRWGESCAERLLGDFAFALWDGERQAVFCARDHVGIEPFYYVASPGLFACASETRALMGLDAVEPRLDEAGVAAFLLPALNDGELTLVRDVKRLPAGHTLTAAGARVRLRRYWRPNPRAVLRLASDRDYAVALRETLTEAVRCRRPAGTAVGTALSGGLDSSSVAVLMRRLRGDRGPMPAFSVLYGPNDAERARIEAVLAAAALAWRPVQWSGELPLADPRADISFFSTHMLANRDAFAAAPGAGVRVLFGGDGGDQALSWGHLAHASRLTLIREGQWDAAARQVARIAVRGGPAVGTPAAPPELALLGPALARRLDAPDRLRERADRLRRGSLRAQHAARLELNSAVGTLEADSALAARHGVVLRSPFWDRRVLELGLAMPADQKEGRGMPRVVLRRAMDGLLPAAVLWRQGKWSGRTPIRDALEHTRRASGDALGLGGPLAELLEPGCVRAAWALVNDAEAPASRLLTCWSLAWLDAQIQAHALH